MRRAATRRTAVLALVAGALVAGACTEKGRSPVGVEVLPGGLLENGLQVLVTRGFSRALSYDVFPAQRADADRLVSAHDWPAAPGIESRPVFFFDARQDDSLAQHSTLLDASLQLVYSPRPRVPVTFTLHALTSDWSEEGATWTQRTLGADWGSPGGDFDAAPVATFTIDAAPDDSTAAIPDTVAVALPNDLVDGWRKGEIENHGLILVQETSAAEVEFASRSVGGANPNGPTLIMNLQLEGEGNPVQLTSVLAHEDTFLATDRSALSSGDLGVNGGDPIRRIFLQPTLGDVPEGASVAAAKLILTVEAARVPDDSLSLVALDALSDFRGEKTVYGPLGASSLLGYARVPADVQPGDTVVFEHSRLTRLVRDWIHNPDSNRGFGILVLNESYEFGGIRFYGTDAAEENRPRLRLLLLPPSPEEQGS